MKNFLNRYSIAAAALAAVILLFAPSCSKEDTSGDPTNAMKLRQRPITNKETQRRILELQKQMPTVVVYNSTMNKYISLDLRDPRKFNFSNPSGGAVFTSPSGTVQFVNGGNGSFTVITAPGGSGGSGGGGGVVGAGDVTLDINYVVCFNSGGGDGFDLFGIGEGLGFSGAIGIAGDFEALARAEIDEDTDLSQFFQGFVGYYVFAGTPSGNYQVIDFFDFEGSNDESAFNNKGIAYLFSFQNNQVGFFLSKSGQLNFGGSSVSFDGTYFGVLGDFFDFENEPEFFEVSGFGQLECGG
jgi:hypothetical protein